MFPKRQYGKKGWWDDNRFIAFAGLAIFCVLFLVVGFSIKFGCRKIAFGITTYSENAPQRESKKMARVYKKKISRVKKPKTSILSAEKKLTQKQIREDALALEVTKQELRDENAKRLERLAKSPSWDPEFGDLMYHTDGSLRDPCPGDAYTAEQNYWILVLALWGVFVIWAGVGTGGNPIAIFIACIIGLLGSIVVFCW